MDIEQKLQELNKHQKTEYLKTLSADDRLRYTKHRNFERQKKYKENPDNKKKATGRAVKKMKEIRADRPEYYNELNKDHNKVNKKKAEQIKTINQK